MLQGLRQGNFPKEVLQFFKVLVILFGFNYDICKSKCKISKFLCKLCFRFSIKKDDWKQ